MSGQKDHTPDLFFKPRGFNLNNGLDMSSRGLYDGITGRRILAYIIDAIVLFMLYPLAIFLGILSLGLLAPILTLALGLAPLLYHTLLIASPGSATIGHRVMGLRVVDVNGQRPEALQALLLTALFYGSLILTGGLILIWCLFDERSRCLHDIFSGTSIIRADNLKNPSPFQ
jgi:uncharacterized RDD family membrane protein YckC